MARCQSQTQKGTRCKNPALQSGRFCRLHEPQFRHTSERTSGGTDQWISDQSMVSTIGGATIGAFVAGPLGALVGGAIGAFMGGYHKDSSEEDDDR